MSARSDCFRAMTRTEVAAGFGAASLGAPLSNASLDLRGLLLLSTP